MARLAHIAGLAAALAGCSAASGPETSADVEATRAEEAPFEPIYRRIETRRLDDTLVSMLVEMEGARDNTDVAEYGKCAAAQYALIRGYGFARHVRTNVVERGGIWRGDAVYTISAAKPQGLQTIDAREAVQNCLSNGIPTV